MRQLISRYGLVWRPTREGGGDRLLDGIVENDGIGLTQIALDKVRQLREQHAVDTEKLSASMLAWKPSHEPSQKVR
jgi:hypothetical protein